MDARIVFLLFALGACGLANGYGQNFKYTIKNAKLEPFFTESIQLKIKPGNFLIDYMEEACRKNSTKFTRFSVTYYPNIPKGSGYMVDAINKVSGYWKIFNNNVPLDVGISLYVPKSNDNILFDLQ